MPAAARLEKPNIVILLTDQERYPQHYPDGWADANLPTRRRLIQNGLTFEHAFNNTSMCSPSRTTILTGLYPAQHLVTDTLTYPAETFSFLETSLAMSLQNVGKLLKPAGYRVAYKGKWHLTKPMNGTTWTDQDAAIIAEFGFDDWDPPDAGEDTDPDHFGGGKADNDGRFVNDAVAYLNGVPTDRPFALIVSLVNPHDVLGYPSDWRGQYDPSMLLGPIDVPRTINEDLRKTKPRCQQQVLMVMNKGLGALVAPEQQAAYVNFYANLQTLVDGQLGTVVDALQARGLLENTIIIRIADHGEMGLSHGGLRQKAFIVYEEAIRIPLIISNPVLFPAPRRTAALAGLVDLLPTIASMTGATPPADWRFGGRDLSPVLADPKASVQDEILFTYDDQRAAFAGVPSATEQPNHIRCIRTGDWKYAYYFDPKELTAPAIARPREYEMYDLSEDPFEVHNLGNPEVPGYAAPKNAAMRKELAARLDLLVATRLAPPRAAG